MFLICTQLPTKTCPCVVRKLARMPSLSKAAIAPTASTFVLKKMLTQDLPTTAARSDGFPDPRTAPTLVAACATLEFETASGGPS
jgi:hypothetical protein